MIAPALAKRLPAPPDHVEWIPEGTVVSNHHTDQLGQRMPAPIMQLNTC
jgi:hypothetical protein